MPRRLRPSACARTCGRQLMLGIRPEDLHIADRRRSRAVSPSIPGSRWSSSWGPRSCSTSASARIPWWPPSIPPPRPRRTDQLQLAVNPERLHFFDARPKQRFDGPRRRRWAQLAKRNSITSPSLTTYSLPSSAHLAGFLGAGFAVQRDVVVVGDGLGADEALLEIGVDDAGGLRRLGARVDGPGARFLRPGGEIGAEAEQLVAGADQPVEAGLGEAQRLEELGALGSGELGDLGSRSRPR